MKMKGSSKEKRVREWFLTVPADGQKAVSREQLEKALSPYELYAGQKEKAESGYLHWQILLRHSQPVRFSTLKRKLPTAHLEPVKDLSASYRYCLKEKTRVPGEIPLIKGEWNDLIRPKEQGKRSDLMELRELVISTTITFDELLLEHEAAIKFIPMLRELIAARDRKRFKEARENLQVRVFYGETGTGKSQSALNLFPDEENCRVTSYETGAFDNYQAQKVLILDEFRGDIAINTLLNLLDKQKMELPARYSNKPAGYEEVIICSNLSPLEWYPDIDTVTKKALLRRLHEVYYFSEPGVSEKVDLREIAKIQ